MIGFRASRVNAYIGVSISVIVSLGFVVLFFVNPQTLIELNNFSLTAYNIGGMDYRGWVAVMIYLLPGILGTLFAILLHSSGMYHLIAWIGKVMLIIANLVWVSFGVIVIVPQDQDSAHLLLLRIVLMFFFSSLGSVFVGAGFSGSGNKLLRAYFILTGGIVGSISLLSMLLIDDYSWARTNLLLVVYFSVYCFYGVHYLLNPTSKELTS